MAQHQDLNERIDDMARIIDDLERDVAQLRQNIVENQYGSDAARERDVRQLAYFLNAIAVVNDMVRELEEERANLLLQEEMEQMNMEQGGNAN